MRTLITSYFLILVLYLTGEFVSVCIYGDFLKTVMPHYPAGTLFITGVFFLLPAIILLMVLGSFKEFDKKELLKAFLVYCFASFLYVILDEVNVYTAKNPLSDFKFWINFVIYVVLSFAIILFFSYSYFKARRFKDIFLIFFSFLLIGALYSFTVKKYFVKNRVESEIFIGKKIIKGKIIAEDGNFIYVINKRELHLVGKGAVDLVKINEKNKF